MATEFKLSVRGQGPDLVLLHGWAMHSGIWGRLIDALAADFRIHLVDLPGHGVNHLLKLPPDLDTIVEMILSEVPPASWMGWSLGGLVALAAALKQPSLVGKLVMVAATPSFSRQEDWEWGMDLAARQAFSGGLENNLEETIGQFALQTFGGKHLQESLSRLGDKPLIDNLPTQTTLEDGLRLLYDNNLLPRLGECITPALVLGGSRDRVILPASFEQTASRMPRANLALIHGGSHAPFISHTDVFLQTVQSFLLEGKSM